jgi:hypothetical protein
MADIINIWGGRAREGLLYLEPFSDQASDPEKDHMTPMIAYLTKFPTMSYGTDWGDWEHSNTEFVSSKIQGLAGGGKISAGKSNRGISTDFIALLAGSGYKNPILTDQWTQTIAQNGDKCYINLDLELVAFPVIRPGTGSHVEGMRYDSDNMDAVLNVKYDGKTRRVNSFWDWLKFGKTAMMPIEKFSSSVVAENLNAIYNNMNGPNGKMVKHGLHSMAHFIDGFIPSSKTTISDSMRDTIKGAEEVAKGLAINGTRIGHTFTVQLFDCNRKKLLNSKAPACPIDFYVTNLKFKFSPKVVKIIDDNGKRKGAGPEWCEISMTLTSVTMLSIDQVLDMCKYEY